MTPGGSYNQNNVLTPDTSDQIDGSSSISPHEGLMSPDEQTPTGLTIEQKTEIATFCTGNPELSEDSIRESYTEKFKKIITPDMLNKIMKLGK